MILQHLKDNFKGRVVEIQDCFMVTYAVIFWKIYFIICGSSVLHNILRT